MRSKSSSTRLQGWGEGVVHGESVQGQGSRGRAAGEGQQGQGSWGRQQRGNCGAAEGKGAHIPAKAAAGQATKRTGQLCEQAAQQLAPVVQVEAGRGRSIITARRPLGGGHLGGGRLQALEPAAAVLSCLPLGDAIEAVGICHKMGLFVLPVLPQLAAGGAGHGGGDQLQGGGRIGRAVGSAGKAGRQLW